MPEVKDAKPGEAGKNADAHSAAGYCSVLQPKKSQKMNKFLSSASAMQGLELPYTQFPETPHASTIAEDLYVLPMSDRDYNCLC